jgi:hypothetical protein
MIKSNNTYLYFGLAAGTIALGYYLFNKPIADNSSDNNAQLLPPINPVVQPKALNTNLLLKIGVKGQEVSKLQAFLGVNTDGVFGSITENALFKLKGVKETTLNKFSTLPTVNQNILPKGSRVLVNNPKGTDLFISGKKADGTFYLTNEIFRTFDYGKDCGIIKAATPLGNFYLVEYSAAVFFVKAADVKKY